MLSLIVSYCDDSSIHKFLVLYVLQDVWVMATCTSLLPDLIFCYSEVPVVIYICEKTAICQPRLWQQVAKRAELLVVYIITYHNYAFK